MSGYMMVVLLAAVASSLAGAPPQLRVQFGAPSVVGPMGRPITLAQAGGGTIGSDAFYAIGQQDDGVHLMGGLSTPGQGAGPASLSHPQPTSVLYSSDSGASWKIQNFSSPSSSFLNVLVPQPDGSLSTFGGVDVYPGSADPHDTPKQWNAVGSASYRVSPSGELTAEVDPRPTWITGLPYSLNTGFRGNMPLLYRALQLPDGTWLATAVVFWAGIPARTAPPEAKGWVPGSVICLRSHDSRRWTFTSLIANATRWQLEYSTFGPSENDLVLLKDNKTLMAVIRMDGDSGCGPTYKAYHSSFSTDFGHSFSPPVPMSGTGCVRPKLLVMPEGGPLVLSGGRLCTRDMVDILMWINWSGDGRTGLPRIWEKFSLTYWHNRNAPSDWNSTYRFDANVNSTRFFDTLAYTSLVRTGPHSGLVFYQKFLQGAPGQWPPWPSIDFMLPFRFCEDCAPLPPSPQPSPVPPLPPTPQPGPTPPPDPPAPPTPTGECAADYNCSTADCGTKCSMTCCDPKACAGPVPAVYWCPPSAPVCVGFIQGKQWGHCTARPAPPPPPPSPPSPPPQSMACDEPTPADLRIFIGAKPSKCSDHAPGTSTETALCSPKVALKLAQNIHRASSPKTLVHLVLAGGTYLLNETLRLTKADSCTVLTAAKGERPIISGGIRLPASTGGGGGGGGGRAGAGAWMRSAFNSSIWRVGVPKGTPALRQLYVDGVRATRTTGNASTLFGKLTATAAGYTTQHAVPQWRNTQSVELLYLAQLMPWTAHRCRVTNVSSDGHSIGVEQPCLQNLGEPGLMCDPRKPGCTAVGSSVRWWLSGLPSSVENAWELLNSSQPGTFYHDEAEAAVYYIPREGEDMTTVEVMAPVLQTLLSVDGTHGLSLKGLSFEHSTWRLESQGYGYTPVQAGWHNVAGRLSPRFAWACNPPFTQPNCPAVARVPGGVVLNDAAASIISNCRFRNMGGSGLDILGASSHNLISSCLVENIGGAGIQIGGADPCPNCPECTACPDCVPPSGDSCPHELDNRMNFNNSVVDTVVTDTTCEFQDTVGIWAGYTRGLRLVHNSICRTNYGGISVGWGWAGWDVASKYSYSRDNEIGYNRIDSWMKTLEDSGAIYTLGPGRGSSLHHNFGRNGGSGVEPGPLGHPSPAVHGGGWYFDAGGAFWAVSANVLNCSTETDWIFGGQWNLTISGNFYNNPSSGLMASHSTVTDNTHVNLSVWPAAAQAIMAAAGVRRGRESTSWGPGTC